MTKYQGAVLAGLIAGLGLAVWQWRRVTEASDTPDPGEVIFKNTPEPPPTWDAATPILATEPTEA